MKKFDFFCFAAIFFGAFPIFTNVEADSFHVYPWEKRGDSPRKYCGNILADILQIVCKGNYYSIAGHNAENLRTQKKTSGGENEDGYWLQTLEEPSQEEYPFRSRLNSASMFRHRIFRRNAGGPGIVQECCVKGCTFSELSLYCGFR